MALLAAVVCLLAAEVAPPAGVPAAGSPLVLDGALPFSRSDLEQAIAVRMLAGATLPDRLHVTALAADRIEVRLGDRRRVVEVGGSTGEMTARLVAISIADLLMETAPAPLNIAPPARPPAPEATPPLRVTALSSWGHGLGNGETSLYGVAAGVDMRRGRWQVGAAVGYGWSPTERAGRPGESSFTSWPVRAHLGLVLGRFAFRLGPIVAPYNVKGAVPRSGTLVGFELGTLMAWSLSRHLRLLAALGCDGFANRTATTVGGTTLTFASPRFAPWAGLGLAWEMGS